MSWLLEYADLLSGGFGLVAAVAFGWPAFGAVRAKRYWERHQRLKRTDGLSERNLEELSKLAGYVDALQLAGSREARICNLVGAICLGISFILLMLAGVERRQEASALKDRMVAASPSTTARSRVRTGEATSSQGPVRVGRSARTPSSKTDGTIW